MTKIEDSDLSQEPVARILQPFVAGVPNLRNYAKSVIERKDFIVELSRAERNVEQLDTFFGRLWNLISPLLSAGIYFVFLYVVQGGSSGAATFLNLVAGIFVFEFISTVAARCSWSIVGASGLISNTYFPKLVLPAASLYTALILFFPSLIIYGLFHLGLGQSLSPAMLQAVPAFVLIVIFSMGLGMFVATAQVYFRDTNALIPFLMRMLMFTAPVLYFAEQAKELLGGRLIAIVNPLFCMIEIFSDSLSRGSSFDVWTWVIATCWSLAMFVIGFVFLVRREGEFAARI